MKADNVAAVVPWYKQFWPWFLIALPASVVIAGLSTLVLAVRHSDALVSDNYYRDGLAINMVLEQDQQAAARGLAATIYVARDEQLRVELDGKGDLPQTLTLEFQHPTSAAQDRVAIAVSARHGLYYGGPPELSASRYYLRLLPGALEDVAARKSAIWRLQGEIDLRTVADAADVRITANPVSDTGIEGGHSP